jgi:tRNA nucleotidyltransferase (CCA-adding enzyme)
LFLEKKIVPLYKNNKMKRIKKILRENITKEIRFKIDFPTPKNVLKINDIFKKNGFELFIIGGAVRDVMLGTQPKDFDLVTNAIPDKIISLLENENFVSNILETGKAFGVINVITTDGEYEIATMRKDIGSGRRPDSVEFTDIKGDLIRRDLTINALFFDIDTKEIVDLVGGVEDLKKGIVRTVGPAQDRFGEDRLRILRAIRFAGRFGSGLDPDVDVALQQDASLEGISGERIRDEFIKGLISAKSTDFYLLMLDKYKLFDWIFPNLDVDTKVFRRNKDYKIDDYLVLLARLLKFNNVDVLRKKLNELKYSADEIKAIVFLISLLKLDEDTAYLLKKVQQTSGVTNDQIRNFGANEGISSQLLDAFENFRLTVTGPEAMEKFNINPGPELGKAIQKMETDNFKKILGLS